jgi:hypothetical protein
MFLKDFIVFFLLDAWLPKWHMIHLMVVIGLFNKRNFHARAILLWKCHNFWLFWNPNINVHPNWFMLHNMILIHCLCDLKLVH